MDYAYETKPCICFLTNSFVLRANLITWPQLLHHPFSRARPQLLLERDLVRIWLSQAYFESSHKLLGINLAFSSLLLSRGCNVVFADLGLRPEAKAITDKYSGFSSGPRAIFQKTDVTDWTQLSKMFEVAEKEFGGTDLVCPGAGMLVFA